MGTAAQTFRLALGLLVLLGACAPASVQPFRPPQPDDRPDDRTSRALVAALLGQAARTPSPVGSFQPDFRVQRSVPQGPRCDQPAVRCIDHYLREAAPIRPNGACLESVLASIEQARAAPIVAPPVEPGREELVGQLESILALPELLGPLEVEPVRVRILRAFELTGGHQAMLELEHPALGAFLARLLLPRELHRSAIVVLPGHPEPEGDDPAGEFLDLFGGRQLYVAGHALLVLEPRGYDSRQAEHDASVALLCKGRPLAGFRQAEAMVLLALARRLHAMGRVGPVGAMGHSGGSTQGSILYRLDPDLAFWIVDAATDYATAPPCRHRDGLCVEDSTVPALAPLSWLLGQPDRPPSGGPVLFQRYGYPEGMGEVREFLSAFQTPAALSPEPGNGGS